MKLADHEKQNPLWVKLKAQLESRLAMLRAQNDGAMDAEKTATLRGRIAEVKAMLEMDKEMPTIG